MDNSDITGICLTELRLAQQALEKAAFAATHCEGWARDTMLDIAFDYVQQANCNHLEKINEYLQKLEKECLSDGK